MMLKIKHLKYQDASEKKCNNFRFREDLYGILSLESVKKKIYKNIFLLVKTVLLLDTCVSMKIQGSPISHPAGFPHLIHSFAVGIMIISMIHPHLFISISIQHNRSAAPSNFFFF